MKLAIIITKWLARFPHELPIITWHTKESMQVTVRSSAQTESINWCSIFLKNWHLLPRLLIDDEDDTLLMRSCGPNPSVVSMAYVLLEDNIFNLSRELMRLIPLNGDRVSTTRSFRLFSSAMASVTKEFSKCNTIHWRATTNSCIDNFVTIRQRSANDNRFQIAILTYFSN